MVVDRSTQHPLICSVSSITTIDLTAGVARAVLDGGGRRPFMVLLNRSRVLSDDPERRRNQSALAIGLPYLQAEVSGVVRQRFEPIEEPGAVLRAHRAISDLLPDVMAREVDRHGARLRSRLAGDDAHQIQAQLVERLLDLTGAVHPDVRDAGHVMRSAEGQRAAQDALACLARSVRGAEVGVTSDTAIRFRKGGHVTWAGSAGNERADGGWATSEGLVLKVAGAAGSGLRVDGLDQIELRGPLDLAYLAQLGEPVHLPWYYDELTDTPVDHDILVREVLSPVSVASPARASILAGGDGRRLDPSGYTLLDFDHPTIRAFIAGVVGDTASDERLDLNGWRHLMANYPITRQRALKSQEVTRGYVASRIQDARRIARKGRIPLVGDLGALLSGTPPRPLALGGQLMAMSGLLKALESLRHVAWDPQALTELERNLTATPLDGALDHDLAPMASALVEQALRASVAWRRRIAPSSDTDEMPPMPASSFGGMARQLEDEARLHHKVVAALCVGPLKASLWNLWLLTGHDIQSVIQGSLSRRSMPSHDLSPSLWRLVAY